MIRLEVNLKASDSTSCHGKEKVEHPIYCCESYIIRKIEKKKKTLYSHLLTSIIDAEMSSVRHELKSGKESQIVTLNLLIPNNLDTNVNQAIRTEAVSIHLG